MISLICSLATIILITWMLATCAFIPTLYKQIIIVVAVVCLIVIVLLAFGAFHDVAVPRID